MAYRTIKTPIIPGSVTVGEVKLAALGIVRKAGERRGKASRSRIGPILDTLKYRLRENTDPVVKSGTVRASRRRRGLLSKSEQRRTERKKEVRRTPRHNLIKDEK